MSFAATVTAEELDRDPDPILARLREEEPVAWIPALEMWFVTRWDDVQSMEDHPEIFSACTEPSFLARTLGENMLTLDPPACTRLQKACKPPFLRAGRSGSFAETELPAMCDRLIESMRDDGEADIIAGYAALVSAGSLATVLGLDAYDFREVWDWCEGLCIGVANFEQEPEAFAVGRRAADAVEAAVLARLDELRERPEACGLLHILQAEQNLTAAEIVNNVRLMISGGINEPRDGIGLVVWTMLSDDGLREQALGSPAAMRRLVDEVLRRYTPVGTITRTTTRETELAGVRLPRASSSPASSGPRTSTRPGSGIRNGSIPPAPRAGTRRSRSACTAVSASGSVARRSGSAPSGCSGISRTSACTRRRR